MSGVENYLLAPRAILAPIAAKYHDSSTIPQRVETATEEEVETLIRIEADAQFGLVLMKRLKAEIGGLADGLLPSELASAAPAEDSAEELEECIRQQLEERIAQLGLATLVAQELKTLETEWSDYNRRLALAPGEELLMRVFAHSRGKYIRRSDAHRIALAMNEAEILRKIKELLPRAASLGL